MIFGISGTKRTVRNREVARGVRKERLDCILWQMQTLMCYFTVLPCSNLNLRAISEYNQFGVFLRSSKKPLLNIRQLSSLRAVVSPGRTLRYERRETTAPQNNYNSNSH